MVYDGLWDVYNCYHMGITGERVAQKFGITRGGRQVRTAEPSKALYATKSGKFKEEIIPVEVQGVPVEKDEGIREDTSLEKLAKLPPVFQKDGILTAGNSSQLSDGAAALVVASARKARELGINP